MSAPTPTSSPPTIHPVVDGYLLWRFFKEGLRRITGSSYRRVRPHNAVCARRIGGYPAPFRSTTLAQSAPGQASIPREHRDGRGCGAGDPRQHWGGSHSRQAFRRHDDRAQHGAEDAPATRPDHSAGTKDSGCAGCLREAVRSLVSSRCIVVSSRCIAKGQVRMTEPNTVSVSPKAPRPSVSTSVARLIRAIQDDDDEAIEAVLRLSRSRRVFAHSRSRWAPSRCSSTGSGCC